MVSEVSEFRGWCLCICGSERSNVETTTTSPTVRQADIRKGYAEQKEEEEKEGVMFVFHMRR